MVRDIAKRFPVWMDLQMDEEDWKRLVLAGCCGQKVIPNPFGEGFIVMNKKRMRDAPKPTVSEIIEQMFAFGAEHEIEWTDPEGLMLRREAV